MQVIIITPLVLNTGVFTGKMLNVLLYPMSPYDMFSSHFIDSRKIIVIQSYSTIYILKRVHTILLLVSDVVQAFQLLLFC
jgi:hypothetical protein